MTYNRGAGGVLSQDFINAALMNDYDSAHTLSASGAIDPHTPGRYVITKAGVAALTLGAPVAGAEDGLELFFVSDTANQHTITATGLYLDGAGHVNVATFPSSAGGSISLVAYQGKWIVTSLVNVTMS